MKPDPSAPGAAARRWRQDEGRGRGRYGRFGGTIAPTKLKNAAPDGYTLLLAHIGMSTAPALYRTLPFKPLEDFELIGLVVDVPMTLIAKKDMPAKDFKELLAYIKANKGATDCAFAHSRGFVTSCPALAPAKTPAPAIGSR